MTTTMDPVSLSGESSATRALVVTALTAASILAVGTSTAYAQQQPQVPDTIAQRALACAACHGKEGRATREQRFEVVLLTIDSVK